MHMATNDAKKLKQLLSIATTMKNTNQVPEGRRRRKSYRSGHQRWETLLSRTPTQLRLASPARSHARHEHETKPKPISRLWSTESIVLLNLRYLRETFAASHEPPTHETTTRHGPARTNTDHQSTNTDRHDSRRTSKAPARTCMNQHGPAKHQYDRHDPTRETSNTARSAHHQH
jgi:hypothetical protein